MMTNDELKKKILEIFEKAIGDWYEKDDGLFAEGYTPEEGDNRLKAFMADALIAAGLTFDETTAILAERTNGKTLIHKAQYYDEMKHRAEVAENELKLYKLSVKIWQERYSDIRCFNFNIALKQAEKELAEEGKDGKLE